VKQSLAPLEGLVCCKTRRRVAILLVFIDFTRYRRVLFYGFDSHPPTRSHPTRTVTTARGELPKVQDFAPTNISTHWCTFSRRFALCNLQLQNWILSHHFTLNFQHISQHSVSLPNRNHPALCTHLEGTYPLLFPEFQLMKPIF
jgi:hypothetical protein